MATQNVLNAFLGFEIGNMSLKEDFEDLQLLSPDYGDHVFTQEAAMTGQEPRSILATPEQRLEGLRLICFRENGIEEEKLRIATAEGVFSFQGKYLLLTANHWLMDERSNMESSHGQAIMDDQEVEEAAEDDLDGEISGDWDITAYDDSFQRALDSILVSGGILASTASGILPTTSVIFGYFFGHQERPRITQGSTQQTLTTDNKLRAPDFDGKGPLKLGELSFYSASLDTAFIKFEEDNLGAFCSGLRDQPIIYSLEDFDEHIEACSRSMSY